MCWEKTITNSDKFQTYNTPSISTLFFLNEQVKLMNEVGYADVQALGRKRLILFILGRRKELPEPICSRLKVSF